MVGRLARRGSGRERASWYSAARTPTPSLSSGSAASPHSPWRAARRKLMVIFLSQPSSRFRPSEGDGPGPARAPMLALRPPRSWVEALKVLGSDRAGAHRPVSERGKEVGSTRSLLAGVAGVDKAGDPVLG